MHKFNQRAVEGLVESLGTSTGIKLLDFKKTTKSFFILVESGVNRLRDEAKKPKIVFIHEAGYLK